MLSGDQETFDEESEREGTCERSNCLHSLEVNSELFGNKI